MQYIDCWGMYASNNIQKTKSCFPKKTISASLSDIHIPTDVIAGIVQLCKHLSSCCCVVRLQTPCPLFVDHKGFYSPNYAYMLMVRIWFDYRSEGLDHRDAKTVRHCLVYFSASFPQSRPDWSQPGNRTTKSPSLYPSASSELYAFIIFCGTSANFDKIVGCHCTICSWLL